MVIRRISASVFAGNGGMALGAPAIPDSGKGDNPQ
jgi:ABC-type sugar transport system substrate-binding protein